MTIKESIRQQMVQDLERNDIYGINLDKLTVRQKNALINWVFRTTKEEL